ncbi:hypothetical protein EYF80_027825 [Liparis tanakae]|uniref:Uncharacterized protein n=1 Tax=Liparis tanakae TaxID=230148 RepID=A0A4Z2H8Z2_9TELE|nr:hypothetical protein EYF80_027825 [Liparis tanakae]
MYLNTRKTVQIAVESRFVTLVQIPRLRARICYYVQVVEAGSVRRLLQGNRVLRQADAPPDLYEAEGLQEEGLKAARFLDLHLSHGREVPQLAHQQRVLCNQRAVLLQDLSKSPDKESRVLRSRSTTWLRVSSGSCCQSSILRATAFPLEESSSSQGFRRSVRTDTWRPFSSLSSSMFWLICRRTRSLYSSQAENKRTHQHSFHRLSLELQSRNTQLRRPCSPAPADQTPSCKTDAATLRIPEAPSADGPVGTRSDQVTATTKWCISNLSSMKRGGAPANHCCMDTELILFFVVILSKWSISSSFSQLSWTSVASAIFSWLLAMLGITRR